MKTRDFAGFERVSAMDISQRPHKKVEADVLGEDLEGREAEGGGVTLLERDREASDVYICIYISIYIYIYKYIYIYTSIYIY